MQLSDIRKLFLDYFSKNGHEVVKSSPLIPHNDPTLLFTNSGMVQFKNYFTGAEKAPFKTATSSQKCLRAGGKHNDLENVGYTARHHTFFEMLGNFSFGDYFKEKAIYYAWDFIKNELQLDTNRLYFTVYHEDVEARDLWRKVAGVPEDRIISIATHDNFWSMGDTGPCGPCSEIFYDHGPDIQGGLPGTPEEDGDRYVEIWNMVFMQYEAKADGSRISLPAPCVDTGMGLERIAAVLQGVHDNYDTDLFSRLIERSVSLAGGDPHSKSHRVIADHIRAASFLIADGVLPGNEGREYVLRRIIRRAIRHIHQLGASDIVFHRLVPTLVELMGDQYDELVKAEQLIDTTLHQEEERFRRTIDQGMRQLNQELTGFKSGDIFSGEAAFKLYDTYGFPLDLTSDILREKGITVDDAAFNSEMKIQKDRARKAWKGDAKMNEKDDSFWFELEERIGATEFIGYDHNSSDSKVLAIIQNGSEVEKASSGEAMIILDKTPFYAESGGQVGDCGIISDSKVADTQKKANKLFLHHVEVNSSIAVGDVVAVKIASDARDSIRKNHSATHLLHHALRSKLGEHVAQKGSLVEANRLRFDFTHNKALDANQIAEIEQLVNAAICLNSPTNTEELAHSDAMKLGAMALFGEKYGKVVRVISMGDSVELCGGTHVKNTGEIGMFKIISEESIAAGVRRITATTGLDALNYCNRRMSILDGIARDMKTKPEDLASQIASMKLQLSDLEKKAKQAKLDAMLASIAEPSMIGDMKLCFAELHDMPAKLMKDLAEKVSKKYKDSHIVLLGINSGKSAIVIKSSDKNQLDAGKAIKVLCEKLGLKGGGSPIFAQGSMDGALKLSVLKAQIKQLIA